jgi:hypothetical protein
VKIVGDGWMTNYKVAIPPPEKMTIELTTPPTTHAYSLYECSITHKLMHFYYVCLNYPIVYTLIKAIKAGGTSKGGWGLPRTAYINTSTSQWSPNRGT